MEPGGSLLHSQAPATRHYPKADKFRPYPHPISWRSNLILSTHLRVALQTGLSLFLSLRFPHQSPIYTSLAPHNCHVPRPYHSRFDHPNNIWWWIQIMKLLVMWSSSLSCYLVPLRQKYVPQHPLPEHHQPRFLPECERPSLTRIQNYIQNYSPVYFNLCIFW